MNKPYIRFEQWLKESGWEKHKFYSHKETIFFNKFTKTGMTSLQDWDGLFKIYQKEIGLDVILPNDTPRIN